jgi:hypothetical protein
VANSNAIFIIEQRNSGRKDTDKASFNTAPVDFSVPIYAIRGPQRDASLRNEILRGPSQNPSVLPISAPSFYRGMRLPFLQFLTPPRENCIDQDANGLRCRFADVQTMRQAQNAFSVDPFPNTRRP